MKNGRCPRCGRRFSWPRDVPRRRDLFCVICGERLRACQSAADGQRKPLALREAPTGAAWFRLHGKFPPETAPESPQTAEDRRGQTIGQRGGR